MGLDMLLRTVVLVGSNMPAYIELFNEVKAALSPADQATAQAAYDQAFAAAGDAHRDAQSL